MLTQKPRDSGSRPPNFFQVQSLQTSFLFKASKLLSGSRPSTFFQVQGLQTSFRVKAFKFLSGSRPSNFFQVQGLQTSFRFKASKFLSGSRPPNFFHFFLVKSLSATGWTAQFLISLPRFTSTNLSNQITACFASMNIHNSKQFNQQVIM